MDGMVQEPQTANSTRHNLSSRQRPKANNQARLTHTLHGTALPEVPVRVTLQLLQPAPSSVAHSQDSCTDTRKRCIQVRHIQLHPGQHSYIQVHPLTPCQATVPMQPPTNTVALTHPTLLVAHDCYASKVHNAATQTPKHPSTALRATSTPQELTGALVECTTRQHRHPHTCQQPYAPPAPLKS